MGYLFAWVLAVVWVVLARPAKGGLIRLGWVGFILTVSVAGIVAGFAFGSEYADSLAENHDDSSYGGRTVTETAMQEPFDENDGIVANTWEPAFFAAITFVPGAVYALFQVFQQARFGPQTSA